MNEGISKCEDRLKTIVLSKEQRGIRMRKMNKATEKCGTSLNTSNDE